jgi:hypothetical protein
MRRIRRMLRHRDALPLGIALATTLLFGAAYLFFAVGPIGPDYGPEPDWFAPSIMWAGGHGLITPQPAAITGLPEFLRLESTRFDVDAVPEAPATWELSPFCQTHRYLLYVVGFVWRLFGVSWHTIKLVPLAAYVLSAGALYGLFRLACGRWIALAGALFVMFSPAVVAMLPSVRDFCKMPFFLLIFLALGLLVRFRLKLRRVLMLSAMLGLFCGVGLGFRQDFLALCVFLVVSAPVLSAVRAENGAVSSHSLAQGLSVQAENTLGFGGASYEHMATTNDNLVHATVLNFARRQGFTEPVDHYLSPAYGDAGRIYFRAVVLTFPYDLAVRAFAAVRASFHILDRAPDEIRFSAHFQNRAIQWLAWLYAWPAAILRSVGLIAAMLFLLALAATQPRGAFAMLVLLLFFTGYTSVLFQFRHAFHLAFVGPFFLAAGIAWFRHLKAVAGNRENAGRALVLATAVVVGIMLVLSLLRAYQHHQVAALYAGLRSSGQTPVALTYNRDESGTMARVTGPVTTAAAGTPMLETPGDYLVARFDRALPGLVFDIVYEGEAPGSDFTQRVRLPDFLHGVNGPVSFYFPVYEAASVVTPPEEMRAAGTAAIRLARARFAGLRFPSGELADFEGIGRVAHAEALPFWLYCWLGPDDTRAALHKQLRGEAR